MLLAPVLAAQLAPIPNFEIRTDPLTISRPVEWTKPFTVAGEDGAVLGEQRGIFELWQYPIKILSRFSHHRGAPGLPGPDRPRRARRRDRGRARHDHHHVFPRGVHGEAAHVRIEAKLRRARSSSSRSHSARPLRLTFRFKPDVLRMSAAANFGVPNARVGTQAQGSYYLLHTDDPDSDRRRRHAPHPPRRAAALPGARRRLIPSS